MTKIGCHVSIAGGIANAPKNAADLGCEVFQMFSRSPQGGPAPKLTQEVIKEFKLEMGKNSQQACYIHTPYYINFASSNELTRKASIRIVREELERGSLLGVKAIMTHLGSSTSLHPEHVEGLTASSAKDLSREEGIAFTAAGVKKVLEGYKGSTKLLLEISAGAGNVIGDTFDELAAIFKGMENNIGICLDSAHMFASGYDLKTSEGFEDTVNVIKKTVGLESIDLIHANDSKVGLGEHKDRHDHIGDGKIGIEGFANLIKYFPEVDLICETKHDKVIEDIKLLKNLRTKANTL